MNVKIEVIPHTKQRYNTIGDWNFVWKKAGHKNGQLDIKVSELGDWRMEFAIAIHELIEAFLCLKDGVNGDVVTKFDLDFEKSPYHTKHNGDSCEPGDHPGAPYQRQHCFATGVERMLIALLGVRWQEYENKINEVCETYDSEAVSGKRRNTAGA